MVHLEVNRYTKGHRNHYGYSTEKIQLFFVDFKAFSKFNLGSPLVFNRASNHIARLKEQNYDEKVDWDVRNDD
jgi:hypothetical protein